MTLTRVLALLAIVAVGAVAPMRAWCEATCIAPTANGDSHCPSHDSADGTTSLSAALSDECPVLESARPAASARLDVDAALVSTPIPVGVTVQFLPTSLARPHRAATVFERSIPLRI